MMCGHVAPPPDASHMVCVAAGAPLSTARCRASFLCGGLYSLRHNAAMSDAEAVNMVLSCRGTWMGPAARSRTRATEGSARPRCPRSRGRISLSTSPSIGDLISSVRSLVGTKKVPPCRVRAVRAVRAVHAASRKGDSKPRPPSRPAGHPAVGMILFRASSAIPVHKRPPFVTHPIPQSLPAIRPFIDMPARGIQRRKQGRSYAPRHPHCAPKEATRSCSAKRSPRSSLSSKNPRK